MSNAQCGFAMLSVGAVRHKNVKNMLLYIMLDATVGALGWYFLGYGFAYGDAQRADGSNAGNGFIGSRFFAMKQLPYAEGSSQFYNWFFQCVHSSCMQPHTVRRPCAQLNHTWVLTHASSHSQVHVRCDGQHDRERQRG